MSSATTAFAQKFEVLKVVPLTDGQQKFTNVKWSHDGKKIAFTEVGQKGIYVIDANGKAMKKLVDDFGAGYQFVWSANNSEIAFRGTKFEENNSRLQYIGTVNVYDNSKEILYNPKGRVDFTPVWNYTGTKEELLLYKNNQITKLVSKPAKSTIKASSSECVAVIFRHGNLYAININGNEKQLTSDGKSVYPVLSPNKNKVIISTNDELIILNIDGSNTINLGKGYHPTFSPDGKFIAYHIATDDGNSITSSDLYIIDIEGNNKMQLTYTPDKIEEFPDWSPSGKDIAYNELKSGKIFKIELK